MFAVPGWAVSAANLKAENDSKASGNQDASGSSKKRKRPQQTVNSENLSEKWESVIEGKPAEKKKQKKNKTETSRTKESKKQKPGRNGAKPKDDEDPKNELAKKDGEKGPSASSEGAPEVVSKKDKKKKRKSKEDRGDEDEGPSSKTETTKNGNSNKTLTKGDKKPAAAAAAPPTPKLTPLQASMREKLVSARFRHLNETLYTKPSTDAFELFEESPEMFQQYHEGFRRQVDVWPENPVDGYLEDIKLRGRQKPPTYHKGKPAQAPPVSSPGVAPLLRTNGVCTIADLGCGDAKLAEALQSEKKKLKLEILSYDLQSPSPFVTKADIANLPCEDGSVNVAIFCLALMGTNWLDFIEEAYRILHWKGELWIAEIKSRFAPAGKGKKGPVTHSVGNRKKQAKKSKGPEVDPAEAEAELAVEVDGVEDKRQETDIAAFVAALQRRGFILQGTADLSNKMFVKMRFIKGAQPVVGKGAVEPKDMGRGGMKKNPVKFIETEGQGKVDETNILKPCVYKLR